VVIEAARAQGRVLVSADTDFGTLLARTHATTPSFLLMRRASGRRAADQAAIILSNLNVVQADLDAGAIVVLGEATLRIRRPPIGAPSQSG
jgi:predicted nuclease of predicted toxin-antitoxin system